MSSSRSSNGAAWATRSCRGETFSNSWSGRETESIGPGDARWSPDGNTIHYWRLTDVGSDTLYAARLEREPVFRVLAREVVHIGERLHAWSWDLHPDGDRSIVPQDVAARTATLTDPAAPKRFYVVVNWFEEMKAKLGAGR